MLYNDDDDAASDGLRVPENRVSGPKAPWRF